MFQINNVDNAATLAIIIRDEMYKLGFKRDGGNPYHHLPYNRYNYEASHTSWLLDQYQLTGHHLGKFIFMGHEFSGLYEAGFGIEKMNFTNLSETQWPYFLNSLDSGLFNECVNRSLLNSNEECLSLTFETDSPFGHEFTARCTQDGITITSPERLVSKKSLETRRSLLLGCKRIFTGNKMSYSELGKWFSAQNTEEAKGVWFNIRFTYHVSSKIDSDEGLYAREISRLTNSITPFLPLIGLSRV